MFKRILVLMLIFTLMFVGFAGVPKAKADTIFVGVPRAKAETPINGMVFLYFKFPAQAYEIFSTQKFPYVVELQNPKWAGLINQGEIKELHIRIPLSESFVYIYYKNPNNFVRRINLKFYSIGKGYILFIFKGEIS